MKRQNSNIEVRYPVGEQSFQSLRKGGYLYVDKTQYIERLVSGSKYYFLGRPRRFGKSLLLSTIKCFFEGKRYLFKDLHIDSSNWSWDAYPVMYLDVNVENYIHKEDLERVLRNHLELWEGLYGRLTATESLPQRFANVIRAAHEMTGRQVVVLVDEFDKPLVNSLHDRKLHEYFRAILAGFYANFKSAADHLRLVLLTGVSRFGKISIFSGLNNLSDITFDDEYADICGITHAELLDNFQDGLQALAMKEGKTVEQTVAKLKDHYDGYRFAEHGSDIYNPFSLLNVMSKRKFANYWIESGTPTLLVRQLQRFGADLRKCFNQEVSVSRLSGLDFDSKDPVPLLYQTGYITIKSYDEELDGFVLGLPNLEVTRGFLDFLLPRYSNPEIDEPQFFIKRFVSELESSDIEGFMRRLQSMFADVPYEMKMDCENNVQNAIYILATLAGTYIKAEYHTSHGRIDLLLYTDRYIYIIELKFDVSPEEALRQIDEKWYAMPFATDGRKVIKIGVNYSSKKRTIDSWQIA